MSESYFFSLSIDLSNERAMEDAIHPILIDLAIKEREKELDRIFRDIFYE